MSNNVAGASEEEKACFDYEPAVSEQYVGITPPCNRCGREKKEHRPYAEWKAAQSQGPTDNDSKGE